MLCNTLRGWAVLVCLLSTFHQVGAFYVFDSAYNWLMYPSNIPCPDHLDSCKEDPQGYRDFVLAVMYVDRDSSGCLDHGEYTSYATSRAGAWFIAEQVVETTGKPTFANVTYERLWERWVNGRLYSADSGYLAGWVNGVINSDVYREVIERNGVKGQDIPKMAGNTGSIISSKLGVTDQSHIDLIRFAALNEIIYGPYHIEMPLYTIIGILICLNLVKYLMTTMNGKKNL